MPVFLDTSGNSVLSIGVCARCKFKFPSVRLKSDPNAPGLMCCDEGCLDQYDPWRLAARAPDNIALRFARPDTPLSPGTPYVPPTS